MCALKDVYEKVFDEKYEFIKIINNEDEKHIIINRNLSHLSLKSGNIDVLEKVLSKNMSHIAIIDCETYTIDKKHIDINLHFELMQSDCLSVEIFEKFADNFKTLILENEDDSFNDLNFFLEDSHKLIREHNLNSILNNSDNKNDYIRRGIKL